MKHRSPVGVFFLSLFTFGIYTIVWLVKTKNEFNKMGAQIPTAWLIIVPIVNLYWYWKYSEGAEKVTGGKISAVLALVMLLVLGIIGQAILQSMYNDLQLSGTPAAVPSDPATFSAQSAAPTIAPNPAPFAQTPATIAPSMTPPPAAPEPTAPPVGPVGPQPPVVG